MHAQNVQSQGWAIVLDFDHLNEAILSDSIQEMLTNSSYKSTVDKLSRLFRDRPMSPLQTAIFWIEYVIRHDGAKHMQSPAVHLNFFQQNSLDILLFLAIILYILVKIIVKVFKFIGKYRPLLILTISVIAFYVISFFM